jgi:hypothetical protein
MRLKCINSHWKEGLKDPDLTIHKFYDSINDNILILNGETMLSLLGDNGEEVIRPKYIFQTMPEMVHQRKISNRINGG